jgi:plasmid stabilization system protein ParE
MRLEFHKHIKADIFRIMTYYEGVAGSALAEEFYAELKTYFEKAADSPEFYPVRKGDLRRVNLQRFPYHFFFRIVEDRVRILVIRHHKRKPTLNLRRR